MITLRWSPVAGIEAYDVFADLGKGFVCVNPVAITSRTQYSFLWISDGNGEKNRVVKGNSVRLFVTALTGDNCGDSGAVCRSAGCSDTLSTRYFEGYARVLTGSQCGAVLRKTQSGKRVFPEGVSIPANSFINAFSELAAPIVCLYSGEVDPRDDGACVPFSTMVAIYFSRNGISCYRAQGMFISQFHSFNLLIIDNVEYVLDFTADQFLPSSSPVFIPRDCCNIDSTGSPSCNTKLPATPMYLIDKVFSADQIGFNDTPEAARYKFVLDSLLSASH
jgi:hypothetical protein